MTILRLYDTETTTLNGEIVEVAYTDVTADGYTSPVSHLIKPYSPIHFEAMATHGITEEMVSEAPRFSEVERIYAPVPDMYVGSHNWQFDSKMLGSLFSNNPSICTLKLTRHLIPKSDCSSHKNMVLYYYLGLHKKYPMPEGVAHRAAFDVEITARVLLELMERFDLTLEDCYKISNGKVEQPFTCLFAKHRGKLWIDVIKDDPDYVRWLLDNKKLQDKDDHAKLAEMLKEG